MEKVQVSVDVAKEAHELSVAMKNIALAMKAAMKDGFQVGQDIPAVIMVAIAELPKAIDGLGSLGEEAKGDPMAFAMGLALPMKDLAVELLKKDA